MGIEIRSFRKFEKNSLKGFLNVFWSAAGLEFRDCSLFEKEGRRWVSFPSRQFQKDGTKAYSAYIKFTDKSKHEKFQSAVLEALDAFLGKGNEKEKDDAPL